MQPSPILNNSQSLVPEVYIELPHLPQHPPAEAVVPEVLQDVAVVPAPQSSSLRDYVDLFTSGPLTQAAYALRRVRSSTSPAFRDWFHEVSSVSLMTVGCLTATAGFLVMAVEEETMPGLAILGAGGVAMLISARCLAPLDN